MEGLKLFWVQGWRRPLQLWPPLFETFETFAPAQPSMDIVKLGGPLYSLHRNVEQRNFEHEQTLTNAQVIQVPRYNTDEPPGIGPWPQWKIKWSPLSLPLPPRHVTTLAHWVTGLPDTRPLQRLRNCVGMFVQYGVRSTEYLGA